MQPCFCIKGIHGFDFYVKVLNTEKIVFNDLTLWVEDEPYVVPDIYTVDIILPDNVKITANVYAGRPTVLESKSFNISKFKDGIYKFEIDAMSEMSGGCGNYRSKTVGIFPKLDCCLQSAFYDLPDINHNKLREIEIWLNNAKVSASLGASTKSKEEWNIAKKLLNNLNCECK